MAESFDRSRRILFTGAAGGIGTMIRPLLAQHYPGNGSSTNELPDKPLML